VLFNLLYA